MSDVKRLLAEATPRPWARYMDTAVVSKAEQDADFDALTFSAELYGLRRREDADLIVHAVNRLPDYEAAADALEKIKTEEGKVCEQYEICEHVACQSSYGAWAIADAALRRLRVES